MDSLNTEVHASLNSIAGEVLLAGSAGFEQARSVWNAMIDRHPGVIVRCKNTDDVIAAVSEAAAAEAVKEEAGNNPQNLLHPGENSSPASPSRKGKL